MQQILDFLQELEVNNNRVWFLAHQEEYQKIRKDVIALVDRLLKSISNFYDLPDDIKPSRCIFRINRDTRFSKNKTPYKTNFGIEISQSGKRQSQPCFYLHIQPGNHSFLAGGLYMPDSHITSLIRESIDKKGKDFQKIINKVLSLKSFYLYDDAVKTSPRGYKKDNPNIALLKLKHRIFERPITDQELISKDIEKSIIKDFEKLSPFVEWIQDNIKG